MRNRLLFGDNLKMLARVPDESVDLIYIDPPFNSARQYNLLFKQVKGDPSPAQIMAFEDTWSWSPALMEQFIEECEHPQLRRLVDSLYDVLGPSEMMAYIVAMAPRIETLARKLKSNGSMYLHCDPVGSPYLRLLMDIVFGPQQFRNEITWQRTFAHGDTKRRFSNISDSILFYARSDKTRFEPQYVPYTQEYLKKNYRHVDKDGRLYNLVSLRSPNPRPNLVYDYKGYKPHPNGWAVSIAKMEQLDAEGRIHFPGNPEGALREKYFLDEMKGTVCGNIWTDIAPIGAHAKERRGFPTQKPVALLERILRSSTNEGDVVLDAFCGCGTTIAAAQKLGRTWIGIDITYLAIREIEERLMEEFGHEKGTHYDVEGLPEDLDGAKQLFELTKKDSHKQFEMWAVSLVGGRPREKKGGDRGIDGDLLLQSSEGFAVAPLQVKGGHLNPSIVRDFAHVVNRERAPVGGLISLEPPTKQMLQEAETLGTVESQGRRVPRLQLLPIRDLLENNRTILLPDGFTRPPSRYRAQGSFQI